VQLPIQWVPGLSSWGGGGGKVTHLRLAVPPHSRMPSSRAHTKSNRNAEEMIFIVSRQFKKSSKAFNLKLYEYISFYPRNLLDGVPAFRSREGPPGVAEAKEKLSSSLDLPCEPLERQMLEFGKCLNAANA
jgi:hypothetical protein